MMQTTMPCPALAPPLIHGAAALAHRAYADHGLDDLLAFIDRPARTADERAALTLDAGFAHALRFRPVRAAALQAEALGQCRLFHVAGGQSARPLRVLAVMAPGDLMVNTPLDFITAHLDVRLELLFVLPGDLPSAVPEHDVAFFAVSQSDPAMLRRLAPVYRGWPRPALNDPAAVLRLSRDGVAAGLDGVPGVCSPRSLRAARAQLLAHLAGGPRLDLLTSPALIRPADAHAGHGLRVLAGDAAVRAFLAETGGDDFFVTQFVDYRSADGLFRKWRIAFAGGKPLPCHMAVSAHWMVHYLNADMAEHQARRDEEAAALAGFDDGFGRRHAAALDVVARWAGLDWFQIDCGELPDGRLVVFEADTAAIVHLMDDPDLFAYKRAPMHRVFAAFHDMLRARVSRRSAPSPAA